MFGHTSIAILVFVRGQQDITYPTTHHVVMVTDILQCCYHGIYIMHTRNIDTYVHVYCQTKDYVKG